MTVSILMLAWLVTSPPGSVPDERAHLVKAVAAGQLDLAGEPVPTPPGVVETFGDRATRSYSVPRRTTEAAFGCNSFEPDLSSACLVVTDRSPARHTATSYVGSYPALLYVAPGLAAALAPDPITAMYLARAVLGALNLALILIALRMARRAFGSLGIVGLLVSLTPMVLFLATSANVSGTEIVSALCFMTTLLASTRDRDGLRRHAWVLALSGSVLALSRPAGPLWLVVEVVTFAVLAPGLRDRARAGGRRLALAALVVVAAMALTVGWNSNGPDGASFLASDPRRLARVVLSLFSDLVGQTVGVFGWLDTALPAPAYAAWIVPAVVVIGVAAVRGSWRERAALGLNLALAGGAVVAVQGLVLGDPDRTNQLVQARYVMPVALNVVLVAGHVLALRVAPATATARRGVAVLWAVVVTVHISALYVYARRNAVGVDGPFLFAAEAGAWAPPGGWWLWAGTLVVAAATAVRAWMPPSGRSAK